MSVNWGALGVVTVVSFGVGVLVVVLVSLAVVGLSARETTRDGERGSVADRAVIGRGGSTLSPAAGTAVAVVCLFGAAAIVLYGLYVIVF